MAEKRCERTDLIVSQCAHCTGARSVVEQAADQLAARQRWAIEHLSAARAAGWAVARYEGNCRVCSRPFEAGALIHYHANPRGWVGLCCAPDDFDGSAATSPPE